jgi:nucleoside-diphosphate-sugar epimerase
MRIAIIGAGGEIGSRLTLRLVATGENPRAIVRHHGARLSRYNSIDIHKLPVPDKQAMQHALQGCSVVVNCAVERRVPNEPPEAPVHRASEITRIMIAAALAAGVKRLIHLSSISVCPPKLTDEAVRNWDCWSNGREWYTRVKTATERMVAAAGRQLEVAIVRPGIVYGPYMDWSRLACSWVADGKLVLPRNCGTCHAVYVDDLVELILHLAAADLPMPCRIWAINPERITWRKFYVGHAESIGLRNLHILEWETHRTPPASGEPKPVWEFARWIYHAPFVPAGLRYSRLAKWMKVRAPAGPAAGIRQGPESISFNRQLFELYSSDASIPPELAGGQLGFVYRVPFLTGVQSAGDWWQWNFESVGDGASCRLDPVKT